MDTLTDVKELTKKEILTQLVDTLKSIDSRLEKLESLSTIPAFKLPVVTEATRNLTTQLGELVVSETVETVQSAPIPLEYRQIVDSVLNRSFDIEIVPRSDAPLFEFSILVPKKYSTVSDEYLKLYKADRRMKVLDYTSGANGVRQWAEKVFNNFNSDLRAMIVQDKITAQ